MMLDVNLARIRAHRNNIYRYQRVLTTKLSELERHYIDSRLVEERASLAALTSKTFQANIAAQCSPAVEEVRA